MKVAVATQDLARVDAHFGWARHLLIYEVSAEGVVWLELKEFSDSRQDGDPGKLSPRLAALQGVCLIFVADIGPEGEHALSQLGVTPVLQWKDRYIGQALESLRECLRTQPPPWLRRAEQTYRRAEKDLSCCL